MTLYIKYNYINSGVEQNIYYKWCKKFKSYVLFFNNINVSLISSYFITLLLFKAYFSNI